MPIVLTAPIDETYLYLGLPQVVAAVVAICLPVLTVATNGVARALAIAPLVWLEDVPGLVELEVAVPVSAPASR